MPGIAAGGRACTTISVLSICPMPEAPAQRGGFTSRERETAILIAEGRPNREIANGLVLRKRTAERHIASMLSKRRFTNRVQTARCAAERGWRALTALHRQRDL